MDCISYRGGYKYQLHETCTIKLDIRPDKAVDIDYLTLTLDGLLTIHKGYAWDGPSGPTFDTLDFMRGSLVHDALYQLMRGSYLSDKTWREAADRTLQRICLEDGMSSIRAWWVYHGVRLGAGPAAKPRQDRIEHAPKACQLVMSGAH